MILAAGYGTRLYPLTLDRAKPAIPFMNRPLVGYVAEYLAQFGCRDAVVNLHHEAESVRRALGDGSRFGVSLHYVEEEEILGTSGAIDNARRILGARGFDETFVAVNGKIVTDIDLNEALATHRKTGAIATLVLRENALFEKYSAVLVRDGFLEGFGAAPSRNEMKETAQNEKTDDALKSGGATEADARASLMFTGIQILEPRIFDYIPPRIFSHTTTDVYPQAIRQGERVAVHVARGMWHELSTLERYLSTHLDVMRRERLKYVAGADSVVHQKATVEDSILWENVTVEAGATVSRSVLGAGVFVRAGEIFEDAVVVRAELAARAPRPEKGREGRFIGANFVAPLLR